MAEVRVMATELRFPEGPVAMADGSVILGEIAGGTVTRVAPDGTKSTVSATGGGPNGLARGPDGALYLCNNGGAEYTAGSFLATGPAKNYQCGYIQRIDPRTGEMRVLYSQCDGHKLSAPNDIVFDRQGGFYFTDLGKRRGRDRDHGGLYYALPDGSKIVELVHPMLSPNGVGLSPDEKTLYVADTESSRLFAFDIVSPGVLRKEPFPAPYTGVWTAWFSALRQPRRRGLEQYRGCDPDHRSYHHDRPRRQGRAAGQDARYLPDQHLLWRPGHEDRLHNPFRQWSARPDGLARARPASQFSGVILR